MADLGATCGIDETIAAIIAKGPEADASETMSSKVGAGNKAAAPAGSGIKPARATVPANFMAKLKAMMTGPEPKVVEVRTEMVPEDYILKLKKKPLRRPPVPSKHSKKFPKIYESMLASLARINSRLDVLYDILRQYDEKGHAVMGVRVMDNGTKTWFILPEEARTT